MSAADRLSPEARPVRGATAAEAEFVARLSLSAPLLVRVAYVALGLGLGLAVVAGPVVWSVVLPEGWRAATGQTSTALTLVQGGLWLAGVAALAWSVRAGPSVAAGPSLAPPSGPIGLAASSGHVVFHRGARGGGGLPTVGGARVVLPRHWEAYVEWERRGVLRSRSSRPVRVVGRQAEPGGRASREAARNAPLAVVELSVQGSGRAEDDTARFRIEEDAPLGASRLVQYRPWVRGLALPGAIVALQLATLLALGASLWASPLGIATGVALVTLVPAAAVAVLRHGRALGRIRRHYAETQGVYPAGAARRVRRPAAPPSSRVADERRLADVPPEPAPRRSDGSAPFSGRLVERAEWEHPAVVTPGTAWLVLTPTDDAHQHHTHGTLALRVVDGGPASARPTETWYHVARGRYPVRVPQTARAGSTFGVEVRIDAGGHTESVYPPSLLVLGSARFVRGPSWSAARCAEGDRVAVGGITQGLPIGAAVRVTVEACAEGVGEGGEPSGRTEPVATLTTEVEREGVIAVDWQAARSPLHAEAAALGWAPPVYRATVEVLGLHRLSDTLTVDGPPGDRPST